MRLKQNNISDILIITLLAFAPLALGAVHTWAYSVIALLSLVLFNLRFFSGSERIKNVLSTPMLLCVILFTALTTLYIIPLPRSLIKFLAPAVFKIKELYSPNPGRFMSLSLYPQQTLIYLLKLLSYIMVFMVIASKIKGNRNDKKDITEKNNNMPPYQVYFMLGAITGVLSILIHSLSDFNLHIPANALYFTVFLAIITGISSSRGRKIDHLFLKKLVEAITLIGFVIAVFAIIQKLSYNGKIYWLIKIPGGHFGPYVNYDHFAGFMEMCIFMAISNFIVRISSSSFVRIKKLKDKIIWFSSREANKMVLYLFYSVVMTTALFLSTSRGGIMSFCAALAVFYFSSIICAEKKKRRRILSASVLVVLLIVIMALWIGPEETVDRFKMLEKIVRFFIKEKAILSELRPFFWQDTLNMIKDFPVFGTGLGTYSDIFQKYRTFSYSWGFLRYAHNDYIQYIAETGLIGLFFLSGFFLWYTRKIKQCLRALKRIG